MAHALALAPTVGTSGLMASQAVAGQAFFPSPSSRYYTSSTGSPQPLPPLFRSDESQFLLRACYGRAAWAANQLEGEIAAGSWLWAPDAAAQFALAKRDHAGVWRRATELLTDPEDIPPSGD